ncbi:MAG: glycoside hydrolase N-terminal domain-containing protein, partial [Armatimonadetes bacterium]|nr:glycoside hydrolase N-terminal domain-containing protein [Armatimonadota bacterium]
MRITDERIADFLSQHDPIWEVAPAEWDHGIPLGNGHIGAMIWGDGAPLKITLDKYDCWELREQPPDPDIHNWAHLRELVLARDDERAREEFQQRRRRHGGVHPTRLPMPRLELDLGPCEWGDTRLHLHEAFVEGCFTTPQGEVTWRAYTHATRNIIVIELTGGGDFEVRLRTDHLDDEAKRTLRDWGYQDPERGRDGDTHWLRQPFPAGGEYIVAWRRITVDGTRDLVLVSLATHNDAEKPLAEALALVNDYPALQAGGPERNPAPLDHNSNGGPDALATEMATAGGAQDPALQRHAWWWDQHWRRSFLTIPDAHLEALYCIETYKLGCSSRPGGLPISLQGVWTVDGQMPPWSGDYHLDSNLQQSYWPVYAGNRLDLGQPLYETFSKCLPRWRRQCRDFFGFDGIWSGCALGPGGERIYGYHGAGFWPGNAAWLAHNYWLHWLYSRDEEFLREHALPLMKGCLQTWQGLLEEGEDGRLHMPLGYSP